LRDLNYDASSALNYPRDSARAMLISLKIDRKVQRSVEKLILLSSSSIVRVCMKMGFN
jgi:hypothetical protein